MSVGGAMYQPVRGRSLTITAEGAEMSFTLMAQSSEPHHLTVPIIMSNVTFMILGMVVIYILNLRNKRREPIKGRTVSIVLGLCTGGGFVSVLAWTVWKPAVSIVVDVAVIVSLLAIIYFGLTFMAYAFLTQLESP